MFLQHLPLAPWAERTAAGLRLTLLSDTPDLDEVHARFLLDNEETWQPLARTADRGRFACFEATIPWCPTGPTTRYCFRALQRGVPHWLAATGPQRRVPNEAHHFRIAREPLVPAWAQRQLIYQIFPDRFARGPEAPRERPPHAFGYGKAPVHALEWGAPLDVKPAWSAFYGGDLAGIGERLGHLQALGVTTVYLTPVFSSGSNHRYDTEDYDHVDAGLGGDEALVALSRQLHSAGLRLVLDAVLNHTGANHPWFNRFAQHAEPGAWQSPGSRWHGWYARDEHGRPVYWKGHQSLPVLDYAHPEVLDAFIRGPRSVLRRWLQPPVSADGWRLDAVHMLGEGPGAGNNAAMLRAMRDAVRDENPEAILVGEHFSEASSWLQGDQEDAAMNYWGFTLPLWQWLGGVDFGGRAAPIATADLAAWLGESRAVVPHEVALAQWNALDSHDTQRLITLLGTDEALYGVAQALQFGYPGVPCIYYGDEVGLEGGNDPDNRRCFDWSGASWRPAVLERVKRFAAWRRDRTELREGACLTLAHGGDWIAFARVDANAVTLLVANRGDATEAVVPLDALPFDVGRWASPSGHGWVPDGQAIRVRLPARDAAWLWSVDA